MQSLRPTSDIVFKMFLLRRQELLRHMVEAVLGRSSPLRELTVLNPSIPKECPADKEIVLDIRVRLDDGSEVDLEMQTTSPAGTLPRFLYYWARAFSENRHRGDRDVDIRPVVSILWLKAATFQQPQFHGVFRILEEKTGEVFTPELEIHTLELSKLELAPGTEDVRILRWARFLLAQTDEERQTLADEDPIMSLARTTLEELSADPEAQRLAREREDAIFLHEYFMARSRREGHEEGKIEGKIEGKAEGKAEGLREDIRELCEAMALPLEEARLEGLSVEQLRQVFGSLLRERKWPEGM
jgi:predicted transposase/invertase (TIGR01784 family)